MVKLVNNSERVITIVDTMLAPGQPKEVTTEVFNHPSVQSMLKEKMPGKDDCVLSEVDGDADEGEEGEEEEASE